MHLLDDSGLLIVMASVRLHVITIDLISMPLMTASASIEAGVSTILFRLVACLYTVTEQWNKINKVIKPFLVQDS